MKNIEDYLRDNKGIDGEFRLKIMECSDDHVIIYINPVNRDGESYDGYVLFDTVRPKSFMDKMFDEVWRKIQAKLNANLTTNEMGKQLGREEVIKEIEDWAEHRLGMYLTDPNRKAELVNLLDKLNQLKEQK